MPINCGNNSLENRRLPLITLTVLLFSSIFPVINVIRAFAWDPPEGQMEDFPGTESSSNYNVTEDARRFDIYTENTRGIQVGEDDESIAFRIKLAPLMEVGGRSPSEEKEGLLWIFNR